MHKPPAKAAGLPVSQRERTHCKDIISGSKQGSDDDDDDGDGDNGMNFKDLLFAPELKMSFFRPAKNATFRTRKKIAEIFLAKTRLGSDIRPSANAVSASPLLQRASK